MSEVKRRPEMDNIDYKLLNPCPYCRNTSREEFAISSRLAVIAGRGVKFYNVCCSCGMTGPDAESAEEAIAKWNRAAPARADSVALVPARIALNLCRAIGERDRKKQEEFVRELAKYLDDTGHGDLAGYALAQIGATPVWVPM